MSTCQQPISIRPAHPEEATTAAELIADAFQHLQMTRWLVPDHTARIPVMTSFLHLTVEHAITWGTVDVTDDLLAVAVWLPSHTPEIDDYHRRLDAATGPYRTRFHALDVAMHQTHPTDRQHDYLPFLAARPQAQLRGLGSALLNHHHTQLDQRRLPAYLEAASPESARLYRRHGYQNINQLFGPTGGTARLRPMWREPRTPR